MQEQDSIAFLQPGSVVLLSQASPESGNTDEYSFYLASTIEGRESKVLTLGTTTCKLGTASATPAALFQIVAAKEPYFGLRSAWAGHRYLQARRRAPPTAFYSQHLGVFEQWQMNYASTPMSSSNTTAGVEDGTSSWSICLVNRQLPTVKLSVIAHLVGFQDMAEPPAHLQSNTASAGLHFESSNSSLGLGGDTQGNHWGDGQSITSQDLSAKPSAIFSDEITSPVSLIRKPETTADKQTGYHPISCTDAVGNQRVQLPTLFGGRSVSLPGGSPSTMAEPAGPERPPLHNHGGPTHPTALTTSDRPSPGANLASLPQRRATMPDGTLQMPRGSHGSLLTAACMLGSAQDSSRHSKLLSNVGQADMAGGFTDEVLELSHRVVKGWVSRVSRAPLYVAFRLWQGQTRRSLELVGLATESHILHVLAASFQAWQRYVTYRQRKTAIIRRGEQLQLRCQQRLLLRLMQEWYEIAMHQKEELLALMRQDMTSTEVLLHKTWQAWYDWWLSRRSMENRAAAHCNRTLLRRALATFQATRLTGLQLKAAADQLHLQRQTTQLRCILRCWRDRTVWKQQMSRTGCLIERRIEFRLLTAAFQRWMNAYSKLSLTRVTAETQLLEQQMAFLQETFSCWKQWSARRRSLDSTTRAFHRRRTHRTLAFCFYSWRNQWLAYNAKCMLAQQVAAHRQAYQCHCILTWWRDWAVWNKQYMTTKRFVLKRNAAKTLVWAFQHWRSVTTDHSDRYLRADQLFAQRQATCLRAAFQSWVGFTLSKAAQHARAQQHHYTSLLRRAVKALKNSVQFSHQKLSMVRIQLNHGLMHRCMYFWRLWSQRHRYLRAAVAQINSVVCIRKLAQTFYAWLRLTWQSRAQQNAAAALHRRRLCLAFFRAVQGSLREDRSVTTILDQMHARKLFALKARIFQSWLIWASAMAKSRALLERHRQRLLSHTFRTWNDITRQATLLNTSVNQYTTTRQLRLLARAFDAWKHVTISDESYSSDDDAASRRSRPGRELPKQMQRLRARQVLHVWQRAVKQLRHSRQASEQLSLLLQTRLLHQAFLALKDYAAYLSSVKKQIDEVVAVRNKRLLAVVFQGWKAVCYASAQQHSVVLSLIAAKDRQHTRQCFHAWLEYHNSKQQQRVLLATAEAARRRQLLHRCFSAWCQCVARAGEAAATADGFDALRQAKRLRAVWVHWKDTSAANAQHLKQMLGQAQQRRGSRVAAGVLHSWSSAASRARRDREDFPLLCRVFYLWLGLVKHPSSTQPSPLRTPPSIPSDTSLVVADQVQSSDPAPANNQYAQLDPAIMNQLRALEALQQQLQQHQNKNDVLAGQLADAAAVQSTLRLLETPTVSEQFALTLSQESQPAVPLTTQSQPMAMSQAQSQHQIMQADRVANQTLHNVQISQVPTWNPSSPANAQQRLGPGCLATNPTVPSTLPVAALLSASQQAEMQLADQNANYGQSSAQVTSNSLTMPASTLSRNEVQQPRSDTSLLQEVVAQLEAQSMEALRSLTMPATARSIPGMAPSGRQSLLGNTQLQHSQQHVAGPQPGHDVIRGVDVSQSDSLRHNLTYLRPQQPDISPVTTATSDDMLQQGNDGSRNRMLADISNSNRWPTQDDIAKEKQARIRTIAQQERDLNTQERSYMLDHLQQNNHQHLQQNNHQHLQPQLHADLHQHRNAQAVRSSLDLSERGIRNTDSQDRIARSVQQQLAQLEAEMSGLTAAVSSDPYSRHISTPGLAYLAPSRSVYSPTQTGALAQGSILASLTNRAVKHDAYDSRSYLQQAEPAGFQADLPRLAAVLNHAEEQPSAYAFEARQASNTGAGQRSSKAAVGRSNGALQSPWRLSQRSSSGGGYPKQSPSRNRARSSNGGITSIDPLLNSYQKLLDSCAALEGAVAAMNDTDVPRVSTKGSKQPGSSGKKNIPAWQKELVLSQDPAQAIAGVCALAELESEAAQLSSRLAVQHLALQQSKQTPIVGRAPWH